VSFADRGKPVSCSNRHHEDVAVDRGTLCGALMRRYWQPAALVEELDAPRPAKKVRLLGEDLVLFRDPSGRYGLLDRRCAHRGADLSFG
jgi:phthalate 4,5-dioxygenase